MKTNLLKSRLFIHVKKPKIIVVLGPTASGKSELAIKLAFWLNSKQARKRFGINGAEVISADSRQVYKGLDIGTGKVPGKWKATSDTRPGKSVFVYGGIVHHLIDFVNPKKVFAVVDYQKLATRALKQILKRNCMPIVCGGTGFYIDALIYDYRLPKVKPNRKLRKKLETLNVATLYALLKKKDPRRAKTIDPYNPRRLIRALEIVMCSNKPVPKLSPKESPYIVLKLGVVLPWPKLQRKIEIRLKKRIKEGLLKEVRALHKRGLSWQRLRELGLEYRYAAEYLTGKIITKHDFKSKLAQEIKKYAKRQITWFKKDPTIQDVKNFKQIKKKAVNFLIEVT